LKLVFSRSELKPLIRQYNRFLEVREDLNEILRFYEAYEGHYHLDFHFMTDNTRRQMEFYDERIREIEEIMKESVKKNHDMD
jgi:hypothetical protein